MTDTRPMPQGFPLPLARWTSMLQDMFVPDVGEEDLSERDAINWAHFTDGQDPSVAVEWVGFGYRSPTQVPPGLSRHDMLRLIDAEVIGWDDRHRPVDPGWAGVSPLCPALMREALGKGHAPREIVAMLDVLSSRARSHDGRRSTAWHHSEALNLDCEWSDPQVRLIRAAMTTLAHVDWTDAVCCLRAGMSPEESRHHVETGRDMEPVRVMAGLLS